MNKLKKYYIHLFPGNAGYLNKSDDEDMPFSLNSKRQSDEFQTEFTDDEINEINKQYGFVIKPKAFEEVKEHE